MAYGAEWEFLERARLWAGLMSFVAIFDEPEPKKRPKPEYDWRVVVAKAREGLSGQVHRP